MDTPRARTGRPHRRPWLPLEPGPVSEGLVPRG
jgi:hypothetical protein